MQRKSTSGVHQLSEHETLTTFHEWRNSLEHHLSQEPEFEEFLEKSFSWKSSAENVKHRGLQSIDKAFQLRRFLAVIANLCPSHLQTAIVSESTGLRHIYKVILSHYQLTPSESTFMGFSAIRQEKIDGVPEKPEQLLRRMREFVSENLLLGSGNLTYKGKPTVMDEVMSPTTERLIVLRWLELLHPSLPALVAHDFHEELKIKTLVDIQNELCNQMDQLLLKCESKDGRRRAHQETDDLGNSGKSSDVSDSLPAAGPEDCNNIIGSSNLHNMFNKISTKTNGNQSPAFQEEGDTQLPRIVQRVSVIESPQYKVKMNDIIITMVLDTGCTGSLISSDICNLADVEIQPSNHRAVQADGDSHLKVVGEVHTYIQLSDCLVLPVDALVVSKLKAGFIVGMAFMKRHKVTIDMGNNTLSFQK